jgi:hypothetical protein
MKKFIAGIGLAAALVASAVSAQAVTIDFDGVTTGAFVDQFYNGGTDSFGASGPNLGVEFNGFATITGYGETSQPNLAYNAGDFVVANVFSGFNSASFTYGFFQTGTFAVYSGLNGSGLLLGAFVGGPNDPTAFDPATILFVGVGHSLVLGCPGCATTLGIDDLQLGQVPVPAALPLFASGLGILGWAVRRRKQKLA